MVVWCCSLRLALVRAVSRVVFLSASRCGTVAIRQLQNRTHGLVVVVRVFSWWCVCPMVVWCCSLRLALVRAVSRVVFLTSRCGTVAIRQLQNRTHGLVVVVRVYLVVCVPDGNTVFIYCSRVPKHQQTRSESKVDPIYLS